MCRRYTGRLDVKGLSRKVTSGNALLSGLGLRKNSRLTARRFRDEDVCSVLGDPIFEDPFLSTVYHDFMSSDMVSVSVRREGSLFSIHVGDVVSYEESGNGKVLSVVQEVVSQKTKFLQSKILLRVRRLYQYSELLRIFDTLSPSRKSEKLRTVDFVANPPALANDPEYLNAREYYDIFAFPPRQIATCHESGTCCARWCKHTP